MKYVKDNCGRWAFIVVSTDDVGPAQLPNAPIVDEQDVMTLPVKLSKSWHVALLHGTPAWIDHESFAFRAVNGAAPFTARKAIP